MIRLEKKLRLPPDLYSRNSLFSLLINFLLRAENHPEKVFKILDVGGYNGRLAWFMPKNGELTVLDAKPAPEGVKTNYIQGDASQLPFADGSFDLVISSDVLEHLPADKRPQMLQEMLRVSRRHAILAAPFNNIFNQKAEELINQQFIEYTGQPHPFLKEHQQFGLPEIEQMEEILHQQNIYFSKIGEGHIYNWVLQQLSIGVKSAEYGRYAENLPSQFTTFFNENLEKLGNFRSPTYRTVLCMDKEKPINSPLLHQLVEDINNFHTTTYLQALKLAFDESKAMLGFRNQLIDTEKHKRLDTLQKLESFQTEVEQLQLELNEKNNQLLLLQAELQLTKNHADNLTGMLGSSGKQLEQMKQALYAIRGDLNTLSTDNARLTLQLSSLQQQQNESVQENTNLRQYSQQLAADKNHLQADFDQQAQQLQQVKQSLQEYKTALETVLNSRSWRLVKIYGKVKDQVWTWPKNRLKKIVYVLKHEGLRSLFHKVWKKILPTKAIFKDEYGMFLEQNALSSGDLRKMKEASLQFAYQPLVSIIVPVYNTDEVWLRKMFESVLAQVYGKWEICAVDDGSNKPHVRKILEKYAHKDPRIKIVFRSHNGGIVAASNTAVRQAKGAYLALLDHDDELTPDALYQVVKVLQQKKYDLIYSDEDKLEINGKPCEPYFKSNYNPDLLLSNNYICHFAVIRRKVMEEVGNFREGTEGAQDYDLMLRITDKPRDIYHIPKVLYHWRKIPGSTAATLDAKPYVFENAKKALRDALRRRGVAAEVQDGMWKGSYRVKRKIIGTPTVLIGIPFKDTVEVLKVAVESVLSKTTYPNYRLVLLNNRSEQPQTLEYLQSLQNHPRITIDNYNQPFNYSAIQNYLAKNYPGDYLVQLNNDTEVISPDWLEALLEHAQRPEVAAVGAKLFYPNGHIQHAGVLIGVGGVANHAFSKLPGDSHGYFGQVNSIRNYSALTFACVMIRRAVYEELQGLDEKNLGVAFNDVDFCLRAGEKGYLNVYTPYAQLYHHESYSRGYHVNFAEERYFRERHINILQSGDPFYNPNLSHDHFDFRLRLK